MRENPNHPYTYHPNIHYRIDRFPGQQFEFRDCCIVFDRTTLYIPEKNKKNFKKFFMIIIRYFSFCS